MMVLACLNETALAATLRTSAFFLLVFSPAWPWLRMGFDRLAIQDEDGARRVYTDW